MEIDDFTRAAVTDIPTPTKEEREKQYFQRLKKGLSLVLYVSYGGARTWRALFYDGGKPRSRRLGTYPAMSAAAAKKAAFAFDPDQAIASSQAGTFKKVAQDWVEDHVDKRRLSSKYEIERHLNRYIYPKWEKRPIFEITRLDVNNLLRDIEKKHGAPQADAVLATIRGVMTWYAVQDHRYALPIVPKMRRDKRTVQERARKRILTDAEIRALWNACDEVGHYGAFVKMLLLTGQRKKKVEGMHRSHIADGVWTIPGERGKGHAGKIKLPQMALDIIANQPQIAGNRHIFPASTGKGPINAFSQRKRELDALLLKSMPGMEAWVQHDLRRTCRSLMARAGVADNIAERALGHAIPGVEGVYNRHDYYEEKSAALQAVAEIVDTILASQVTAKIIPLRSQNAI